MPGNLVTLNRVHARERWRLARECLSGKIAEKNSSEVGQRAQFPGREEAATDGTDLADAALERFVFLCTGHVPRFLATTDPRPMFRKPYWTRLSQITSRLSSFCREKIFLFWSIEKKKEKKKGRKKERSCTLTSVPWYTIEKRLFHVSFVYPPDGNSYLVHEAGTFDSRVCFTFCSPPIRKQLSCAFFFTETLWHPDRFRLEYGEM